MRKGASTFFRPVEEDMKGPSTFCSADKIRFLLEILQMQILVGACLLVLEYYYKCFHAGFLVTVAFCYM